MCGDQQAAICGGKGFLSVSLRPWYTLVWCVCEGRAVYVRLAGCRGERKGMCHLSFRQCLCSAPVASPHTVCLALHGQSKGVRVLILFFFPPARLSSWLDRFITKQKRLLSLMAGRKSPEGFVIRPGIVDRLQSILNH